MKPLGKREQGTPELAAYGSVYSCLSGWGIFPSDCRVPFQGSIPDVFHPIHQGGPLVVEDSEGGKGADKLLHTLLR